MPYREPPDPRDDLIDKLRRRLAAWERKARVDAAKNAAFGVTDAAGSFAWKILGALSPVLIVLMIAALCGLAITQVVSCGRADSVARARRNCEENRCAVACARSGSLPTGESTQLECVCARDEHYDNVSGHTTYSGLSVVPRPQGGCR